ncbi:hypothetical protein OJ996_09105 [Luteolibacter sp. GHJ8]|uniref:Major capsid protein E n=1 Tax=Luteolibacter rhizosphaerae TaxID=2989719 RepID=A0ABT3G1L4_9BACT|nr:hypothetical protein [Luteolibacter rhizosphaerae]MCW1913731.1 hypothetical protein [Luteolibacter rhizosphaerae]
MKAPILNPILSGAAVRYMAALPLVGQRIAPVFNSNEMASAYYVYDTSNFTNVPTDIRRAPSSDFKRLKSTLSSDTFLCKDYGIEEPMDKMELRLYASVFNADQAGMRRAVRVVALNHEIRVRNLARASTQTSSPSVKWNATSGTTIRADVQAAKNAIQASIGIDPNLLTLPRDVYNALKYAPELIELYKYSRDAVLTKTEIEKALDIEIAVANDLINVANEGQAASLGALWTDEAFFSYSVASQDPQELNWARTFNWTAADGSGPLGISTFTYDQNEIDSRVVRARQFTDEKVVAAGAGYYLSNVLA